MRPVVAPNSTTPLIDRVGEDLGYSPWVTVTQKNIDDFADATGDHQWIHVDPLRAATSPLGTTVAHGYLILSIASGLLLDLFDFEEETTVLNYGLDRVRFPASMPPGSSLRMHAVITGAEPAKGGTQLQVRVTFEAREIERPVCVADIVWRVMHD
jgi:acyl dehydratase